MRLHTRCQCRDIAGVIVVMVDKTQLGNESRFSGPAVHRVKHAGGAGAAVLRIGGQYQDTCHTAGLEGSQFGRNRWLTVYAVAGYLFLLRYGLLFAVSAWTGVRPGEASGLTWDDIDTEGRALIIRRALVRMLRRDDVDCEAQCLGLSSEFGERTIAGGDYEFVVVPGDTAQVDRCE